MNTTLAARRSRPQPLPPRALAVLRHLAPSRRTGAALARYWAEAMRHYALLERYRMWWRF
jgi:hypothetical protein